MRARLFFAVVLLAGVIGCEEATDPASTVEPAAGPSTLEERRAEVRTLAMRLEGHEATRPLARSILDELSALGPVTDGARTMTGSPVPLPLEDTRGIAKTLEEHMQALEGAVEELGRVAEGLDGESGEDARQAAEALAGLATMVGQSWSEFARTMVHAPDAAKLRESDVTMRGGNGARGRFDEARIYHGDPSWCEKPAVVDLNVVYRRIPEYREIREKGIKKDGPRYYFLLVEAGKQFRHALRKVASRDGYDVIGGLGAIVYPDRVVPEITDKVIAALPD